MSAKSMAPGLSQGLLVDSKILGRLDHHVVVGVDGGGDPKPPRAAVVKSQGRERRGNVGAMIPTGTIERGECKQTVSEVSKGD